MANICDVSISVMPNNNELTQEQSQAIEKEFEKHFKDEFQITNEEVYYMEIETFMRWSITYKDNLDVLVQLSEKHNLKIRAVGREDGVGFVQVVCIDNGVIMQNEEIGYRF